MNHPGTLGIARLKAGITLEQAQADISSVAASLRADYPVENAGIGASANWLTELVLGGVRPALLMLAGAVGFVLLIACANVVNLMLGRTASRQREMALRGALGARRGRIVRQLLAESIVLGLAGGVLGVALAWAGVRVLQELQPGNLPRLSSIGIDGAVLAFALGISLLTGFAFGLVPALHAARKDPLTSLRDGGRTTSAGRGGLRLRGTLMIAEVAMALVLLVGAGLLVKSFARLTRVDLGFDSGNVLAARIQLPARSYEENTRRQALYAELQSRVRALPGVSGAALATDLPVSSSQQMGITIEGQPPVEPGSNPLVNGVQATPEWFGTLGIPLVSGRGFELSDGAGAVRVALISKAGAKRLFGEDSPLGHRYKVGNAAATGPWITIVGVVGEVANGGFDQIPLGTVYTPVTQGETEAVWIAVRTGGKPESLTPGLRATLAAIDPGVPLSSVSSVEDVVSSLFAAPRFAMLMLLLFATIAVVLAAVGIYGVISYSVSQRAHEIGVRMALGARRAEVVGMVVRQVVVLAGAGIGLGAVGALGLGRVLRKMLFQVTPSDPVTIVAMVAVLAAVALVAAALPAWRASRLDPVSALRDE
jgi:putative ABC transport system permease protein